MKTLLYSIILALGLTSCHILKKEKQSIKTMRQKEELQLVEQRYSLYQQSQLVLRDSSHNDVTVLLWPKGKFTFSVAHGFEGEAEKVVVLGKTKHVKTIDLRSARKLDSMTRKAMYKNEKERSTQVQKNKWSMGYSWAWVLLIPVLWLGYRLYKILFHHR